MACNADIKNYSPIIVSLEKYRIKELPALLIFKQGNLKGHIDGYFENKDKEELMKKINNLLKSE